MDSYILEFTALQVLLSKQNKMKFISLNTKLQKDMEEIILYTKEYMPTYTHIHTHTQTHTHISDT